MDLSKYIDKTIRVKFQGGREGEAPARAGGRAQVLGSPSVFCAVSRASLRTAPGRGPCAPHSAGGDPAGAQPGPGSRLGPLGGPGPVAPARAAAPASSGPALLASGPHGSLWGQPGLWGVWNSVPSPGWRCSLGAELPLF